MAKKKVLTESQVDQAYEVKAGFNVPSKPDKINVGTDSPNFVFEKDFEASEWAALLEMGAIAKAESPEPLKENETIVFEKVED
jgi:hypothetical protein